MKRLVMALVLCCVGSGAAGAQQDYAMAESRAPRFLLAPSARAEAKPVLLDVRRTPVLMQRIAVDLDGVSLSEALSEIASKAGLTLVYGDGVVPASRVVQLKAEQITVVAALTDVLADVGVDVVFNARGGATLVPRSVVDGVVPVTGTITGTVTEAATGNPVPQAQVSVSGRSRGATTGEDGRYSIAGVPAGVRTVTVRRLGYDPQSREASISDGETATADFALVGATTRLAEIVTTVTGAQRRVEMGTAIASVNADSLARLAPVMSFGDLLQGRSPGVMSLQETGISGRAGRLRIRGINSALMANDPVLVIDGVRMEAGPGTGFGNTIRSAATSANAGGGAAPGGGSGRMADLDPDEIESVEVVKGPSAATLYGTDASNGVIVITTKRGVAGRARTTAFLERGLVQQRLDQDALYPDQYYAFGRNATTNAPQRCLLVQRAAGSCVLDSLRSFNVFDDPATRPFRDAGRAQYGVQLSGGTVRGSTYFLSGGYEQETGTLFMPPLDRRLIENTQGRAVPEWQQRPNAFERVNLRANLATLLGGGASATLSTSFVSNQSRMPDFAASLLGDQVGYRDQNDGWANNGIQRPAYSFTRRNEDDARRFTGSLATIYPVRPDLIVRGTLGVDLSTNSYGFVERRGENPFRSGGNGFRVANDLSVSRYNADVSATSARAINDAVSSKTSVGLQYTRRGQRGTFVAVTNLPLGGETIAGGTALTGTFAPGEATLTTVVAGAFLEEVVGFRDRLFVGGAMRFDGSSTFGRDFSVAAYPKGSVSWVVTSQGSGTGRFALPWVNELRVRAAYGASGVQPGPFDALHRVLLSSSLNVAGTGSGPSAALVEGNTELRPERSSELEAGFDLELWQGRQRVEVTAYQRTSTDALVRRPNPVSIGGSRIENLGSVRNEGVELLWSAEIARVGDHGAGVTTSAAFNRNTLRRLGQGITTSATTSESRNLEEGYPLYGHWGFAIESFADANGDGIIEASEIVLSGPDTRFIGPNVPTREMTAAPWVRLFAKRVNATGLLQYRGGFHRRNEPACLSFQTPSCRVQNDIATPLAEQARAVARTALNRRGPLTDDASYVLFRELSVGVAMPNAITRLIRAHDAQLVLAGRNLAVLWKAGRLPLENATNNTDDFQAVGITDPGPSSYWLVRLHLTF